MTAKQEGIDGVPLTRGQLADAATELTDHDWSGIRQSIAVRYRELRKDLKRAHKRPVSAKNIGRPSELAMELADVSSLYDKVAALHPPPAKVKGPGGSK